VFDVSVENVVTLSATCHENFCNLLPVYAGCVCGGWGYTMISPMVALSFINSFGNGSNCCIGLIFMD